MQRIIGRKLVKQTKYWWIFIVTRVNLKTSKFKTISENIDSMSINLNKFMHLLSNEPMNLKGTSVNVWVEFTQKYTNKKRIG